ncbi:MAG: protein kinase [Deltaproteobacteria bacterium]|nr:protein kinase [Deltaproteobacteria bacterium]
MGEASQKIGQVVDRYRIEALLGEGGFGAVYRASHVHMHRAVALKILHPRHAQVPGVVERFMREARAAAAAGSEHIVQVYDCGLTESGEAFLALELLEGEDLDARLARGACSIDETLAIVEEVLAGLDSAHAAGVIHRDLKPANIFLAQTPQGPRVKLLDFGISKMLEPGGDQLTRAGTTLGTPHYMALEQFMSARDVDARADLYALGVVMYEMVSGAFPFEAESFEGMAVKLATEPPRPLREVAPHCPERFIQIVERALARDRDGRFASAKEMSLALASVRGGGALPSFTGTRPVPRATPSDVAGPVAGRVDPSGATEMAPSIAPMIPAQPSGRPAAPTPYPAQPSRSTAPTTRDFPWLRVTLVGLLGAGAAALGIVLLLDALSGEPASVAPLATPGPVQAVPVVDSSAEVAVGGSASAPMPAKPVLPGAGADPEDAPRPRTRRPPRRRPRSSTTPAPRTESPTESPTPEQQSAPDTTRDSRVRIHAPRIVGAPNRAGVASLLRRARSQLSRCQEPGVRRRVRVQLMTDVRGSITLAQQMPGTTGDRLTANCVADVLGRFGPVEGGGVGIVQVSVDL